MYEPNIDFFIISEPYIFKAVLAILDGLVGTKPERIAEITSDKVCHYSIHDRA